MALQFQDISIPLTEGQDGSSDAAIVPLPKLLSIQNGEFDDRGNLQAVDGFTALPITTMTSETAPDNVNAGLRRLLTHKDELLLETFKGTYRQQVGGSFALASGVDNRKREALRAMRAGVTSIVDAQGSQSDDWNQDRRPNAGVLGMDAAQLGDYTCTVWCEQFGTAGSYRQLVWQIRHKTSDAIVGRGRIRNGAAGIIKEPRVVAFNNLFHLYALGVGGASGVGYKAIDPLSTQNVTETMTDLFTGAYNWFDVAVSSTQVCVSGAGAIGIDHLVYAQATPTVLAFNQFVATPSSAFHISNVWIEAAGRFIAFYAYAPLTTLRWSGITSGGVLVAAASQALTTATSLRAFPLKNGNAGNTRALPVLLDSTDPVVTLLSQFSNRIECVIYDYSGGASGTLATVGTAALVCEGAIVAGQPIPMNAAGAYDGGTQGLWLPVQSCVNNEFVVLDIARSLNRAVAATSEEARFPVLRVFDAGSLYMSNYPPASGFFAIGRVCTPAYVPGSSNLAAHIWSAKFTPNITNVRDLGQNPTFIQRNTLDYADKLGFIEFADLTYMAGGAPLVYDGQSIFEEGFTCPPQVFNVTPAGGGALSAGTYSIVFVYEWFDGQGNRWQSQVSPATSFVSGAAGTYTAAVRACPFTLKSGVQIIPYRTTIASQTIYRRDSPLGVAPLSDTAIATSELLYTGGIVQFLGTQSNNALPGVKQFTVHQNRLVAVGGEQSRGFYYSKERDDDFPAEFNRASGFGLVPEVTGRLAAASSFDDKLVLFAENGLSVIFGQGPNRNWLQNGYTTPVRIQAAEGIRFDSPQVGEVDDGVWYLTGIGPRLLSRGLATAKGPDGLPLGNEVRTAGQQLQIGACEILVHPSKSMVVFDDRAGVRYLYDYQRNKWTSATVGSGISMVNARGALYSIGSGVISSNPLQYEDSTNTNVNAMLLEFGWINFAGLARFQRLTHLSVLGAAGSKPAAAPTSMVADLSIINISNPSVAAQNSLLVFSSTNAPNAPWQCEFQVQQQTDTGYKIYLTLYPNGGQPGGNFSLTGLLARVGLKRGGPKLPAAKRG
jgi:hypothetical protein